MKCGMYVGNTISKKSSKAIRKTILDIFRVGHETEMSSEVIVEALQLVGKSSHIDTVNITDCSISTGD